MPGTAHATCRRIYPKCVQNMWQSGPEIRGIYQAGFPPGLHTAGASIKSSAVHKLIPAKKLLMADLSLSLLLSFSAKKPSEYAGSHRMRSRIQFQLGSFTSSVVQVDFSGSNALSGYRIYTYLFFSEWFPLYVILICERKREETCDKRDSKQCAKVHANKSWFWMKLIVNECGECVWVRGYLISNAFFAYKFYNNILNK